MVPPCRARVIGAAPQSGSRTRPSADHLWGSDSQPLVRSCDRREVIRTGANLRRQQAWRTRVSVTRSEMRAVARPRPHRYQRVKGARRRGPPRAAARGNVAELPIPMRLPWSFKEWPARPARPTILGELRASRPRRVCDYASRTPEQYASLPPRRRVQRTGAPSPEAAPASGISITHRRIVHELGLPRVAGHGTAGGSDAEFSGRP